MTSTGTSDGGGGAIRPTLKASAAEADEKITERITVGRQLADSSNRLSKTMSNSYAELYSWDELNRSTLRALFDGPIEDEYSAPINLSSASTTRERRQAFHNELAELLRQLVSIRSRLLLFGGSQVSRYFHVRLTGRGEKNDEVKLDMDQDSLESQILRPYRGGAPITMNGRTITADRIERLRISSSDQPSARIIRSLEDEDRSSGTAIPGRRANEWRAAERAQDVTDQYITGPVAGPHPAPSLTAGPGDKRSVFIVKGRDSAAASAVVAVLRALGLRIVEWEHAMAKTGQPSPYIGDVVMAGLQMADVAVVVLSADDIVRLRDDLVHDSDGDIERLFQGQARPNVFYEAGIADALGKERTLLVEVGGVKSFSDVSGRHVVRYDGTPEQKHALAGQLRVAGLEVDTTGLDWMRTGDVSNAVAAARVAVQAARSRPGRNRKQQ